MRRGLPGIYPSVVANRYTHPAFQPDWHTYYPEMDQYLGFIVTRVPELSSEPLHAQPQRFSAAQDDSAMHTLQQPFDPHRRSRSQSHAPVYAAAAARAYYPSSRGQTGAHP